MDKGQVPDEVAAELFDTAPPSDPLFTYWSYYTRGGGAPSETLRGKANPTFTMPEISLKTVSRLGGEEARTDYTILGQIGEGGMGTVFEARQGTLNRVVALKMIRPDLMHDPLAKNGFYYEAVITAGMEHPGIIPILDFGITKEGRSLYAMKMVTGSPWNRVLRGMTLEDNLEVLDKVADTISHAHAKGVIHRDIKPGNILLGEYGVVWVGDWGVAVHVDGREVLPTHSRAARRNIWRRRWR